MNNKGQSLAVFVILLPVLFMVMGLIIDVGLLALEKSKISNNIKDTIEYGLKQNSNPKTKVEMENLLRKNISNIDEIKINIDNNMIQINVKKNINSIFSFISINKSYQIDTTYNGHIENEKIIINKE